MRGMQVAAVFQLQVWLETDFLSMARVEMYTVHVFGTRLLMHKPIMGGIILIHLATVCIMELDIITSIHLVTIRGVILR